MNKLNNILIPVILFFVLSLFHLPVSASDNIDAKWNEAAELYASRNYQEAADIYAELVSFGGSAGLYYNYANALYKSGEKGAAILNYERALRLDPTNKDIQFNLDFVNGQITDQIIPVEKFFAVEWIESLGMICSSNQWAYVSIFCFVLFLAFTMTYLFSRLRWIRKSSFFVALFLLVISIISFSYSFSLKISNEKYASAIVMSGSVSVKSSPDEGGTEVFVLHEGTKVDIRNVLSDWVEIHIANGNVGWLPLADVERI